MKEFVNDIQNLIVKHCGKTIVVFLIIGTIINYNDVKRGFTNGWKSLDNTNQSKINLMSQSERISNSKVRKMVVYEYKFNLNNIDTNTKRIQQVEEYDTIGNVQKSVFFFNNTDSLITINTPQLKNQFSFQSIRGKDTMSGMRIYNNENQLIEIDNYNKDGYKSVVQLKYKNEQLLQITKTDWKGNITSTTNNKYEDGVLVEQITKNKEGKEQKVENKYSTNNNIEKSYLVSLNSQNPSFVISETYVNGLLVKRIEKNSKSGFNEKKIEIKYNNYKLKSEETIFENDIPIDYYKYIYTLK